MKHFYLLVIFLSFDVFCQSTGVDNTFNILDDGIYQQRIGSSSVPHPDGGMLALRNLSGSIFNSETTVVKLSEDGILDESFHQMEQHAVNFILIKSDGKFVTIGPNDGWRIFKHNANGTPDNSFTSPTFSILGQENIYLRISGALYQEDGKVIVVGNFTAVNDIAHRHIVRLNADGTVDNTFLSNNLFVPVLNNNVLAIAKQADGKLIVAGNFKGFGNTNVKIMRLNSDGTKDTSFHSYSYMGSEGGEYVKNGFLYIPQYIVLQDDGKILVSGSEFVNNYNIVCKGIVRLNSNGTRDTSFSYTAQPPNNNNSILPGKMAMQADGKIVFDQIGIHRILTNGSVDPSFNFLGVPAFGAADQSTYTNIHMQGTKIVLNTSYNEPSGKSRYGIYRLNEDASLDQTFNPQRGTNIISTNLYPGYNRDCTVKVLGNSKVLLVGKFTAYNDSPAKGICRLTIDGLHDFSFTIDPRIKVIFDTSVDGQNLYSVIKEQSDGKIVLMSKKSMGFTVDDVAVKLLRINIDGSLDSSFNISGDVDSFYDFDSQSDNKIITGGKGTMLQVGNKFKVVRLNLDGTHDVTFGSPLYDLEIKKVIVQDDDKIYIIYKTSDSYSRIQRLLADGAIDPSFSTILSVNNLTIQNDGKLLISYRPTSDSRSSIGRLNNDGTVDPSFTINSGSYSASQNQGFDHIYITAENHIVVRPYTTSTSTEFTQTFNDQPLTHSYYVLNANGVLQSTFGSLDLLKMELDQQGCDKLIVTGFMPQKIDSVLKGNIVRYDISQFISPFAPIGPQDQNFTAGQTLADISLDGQNLQWYSGQNSCEEFGDKSLNSTQFSSDLLPPNTPLADGTTYFASQTVDGSESYYRTPITVHFVLKTTSNLFESLKIYPNPVKDYLSLSSIEAIEKVEIFDLIGKQVGSYAINSDVANINLTNLKTGIYIVKLIIGTEIKTVKIVKQ